MIVILEGHDASGKSHLSKILQKKWSQLRESKVPIYKFPNGLKKPKGMDMSSYMFGVNIAALAVCESFPNVIIDRFLLSESVYSRLFRRKTYIDMIKEFEKLSKKNLGPIYVILLHCNYKDYVRRHRARKESFDSDKNHRTEKFQFEAARQSLEIKQFKEIYTGIFNTSEFKPDAILEHLIPYMMKKEMEQ